MKIKAELNSKELDVLLRKDDETKIKFEFEVDIITEGRGPTKEEENLVFGSILWALIQMLPHGLVKQYFRYWNTVVEKLHKEFEERALKNTEVPIIEIKPSEE